ncbi:hypothetical protein PFISCL1PPCAC_20295, partial [Pristionchus fissidentatus]
GPARSDSIQGLQQMNQTPTALHHLFLSNGQRMRVELIYDPSNWSLYSSVDINTLDELSYEFESKEKYAKFTLESDDLLYRWTPDYRNLSFRVGGVLSFLHGSHRVVSQGKGEKREDEEDAWSRVETITVRIRVERGDQSRWNDSRSFIDLCGSRGVVVRNKKKFIPAEVMGLHSRYFLTMFYGLFDDRKAEWIELHHSLLGILKRSCKVGHTRCYLHMESWEKLGRLLEYSDKFDFVPLFTTLSRAAISKLHMYKLKFTDSDIINIMLCAEFSRKDEIMVLFLNRFYLHESLEDLNDLRSRLFDDLTPLAHNLILEKEKWLERIIHSRPKIRFIFSEGEVVVSFHSDIYPSLDSLLSSLRESGLAIFNKTSVLRCLVTGRRELVLDHRTSYIPAMPVELPLRPTARYLYRASRSCICFHDRSYNSQDRAIIGTVVSGEELIPDITTLVSVSVTQ